MRQVVWIDPAGAELALNQSGDVFAGQGVRVAGMPPIRASEITVPLQPGGRWQQVDHGPREVGVPVHLRGDVEAAMDALAYAIDPTRGDGRLRVVRHDGSERELTCRYVDGLQITEDTDTIDVWSGGFVFRAVDPYWYDRNATFLEMAPGTGPGFFPFFPLVLGGSELSTEATVVNDGQAPVWPVWTITGPGSSVVIANTTTGHSFELDLTIVAGETVIVDTRPGMKTVTSSIDGDVFAALTDDSSLWALIVGANDVELTLTGADEDSRLIGTWHRRWLSG